ncbi:MAG TPA: sensor histidine kinase [Cyclobacteriaceae bacterium]|nr:sensor histidine kinase [Cyclobacteriaceae bacterium]
MKKSILSAIIILCLKFNVLLGQSSDSSQLMPPLRISSFHQAEFISRYALVYCDSSAATGFKEMDASLFKRPSENFYNGVTLKEVKYPYYFSFEVANDTKDSASLSLWIGPLPSITVANVSKNGKVLREVKPEAIETYLIKRDYYTLTLPAGQTQRYVLRLKNIENPDCYFSIWISKSSENEDFYIKNLGYASASILIECIFFGMILIMLVYSFAKFISIGGREYLYYACYIFFFSIYFWIKLSDTLTLQSFGNPLFHNFLYKSSQACAYAVYYLFVQNFLNTKEEYPRAHKIMTYMTWFILDYVVIDFILSFLPDWLVFQWRLWDVMRLILILTGLSITITFAFIGNKLSQYLVIGGSILAILGFLSMLFTLYPSLNSNFFYPFDSALTFFELGIIIELIFFTLGLGYKHKRDEVEKLEAQEALKLEIEKQKVRQLNAMAEIQEKERTRVAKDLHDGLGSMLSGIKMSLSNMKGNAIMTSENVQLFERSLNMLDNSIHELRRVAHNLMPETLVKFGLAAALKDFTDFINQSNVLKAIFQQVGEERRLASSTELAVYRLANELINNALRHAAATELIIQLHYESNSVTLTIQDNGKGFDAEILKHTRGSGWPNIRSRVEYLNGALDIDTKPGEGSAITIRIPI